MLNLIASKLPMNYIHPSGLTAGGAWGLFEETDTTMQIITYDDSLDDLMQTLKEVGECKVTILL